MADDTPPRILLVEDDTEDASDLREMLRNADSFAERVGDSAALDGGARADGNVVRASTLRSALTRLDDDQFDVVLLDLDLPDSDGLETLTTLLSHDDSVPVVVLTRQRDRDSDLGTAALRAGAEEFLVRDQLTPGLLVRSIHHAVERRAHRREQQRYETLIEQSADVNAILDPDGTFRYVTSSAEHVLGYPPEQLEGENAFGFVHPDDRVVVREEFDRLVGDPEYRATADFRFERADGDWAVLNARARNLMDDPAIEGLVVYTRDVTEQREYERKLAAQRQRLAALNQLNGVVHGVTEAVIDQSRREEIERITCERLAESASYEFAWIAEPDPAGDGVSVRAQAGTDGYLDEVSVSVGPDEPEGEGPTGKALRTGEAQTVQRVDEDPDYEPWRDVADRYGFKSSAAVPIRYEDTTFGVLNVYADRPDAFREEERNVVEHLGRLVGHAIAAAERKQALLSDTVVELELRVEDVIDELGVAVEPPDDAVLERAIPVGENDFLVYGTVPERDLDVFEELVASVAFWESMSVVAETEHGVRFELRMSDPPMMTAVAELGGSVERVRIDGRDVQMTIHLPQDVEVREVVETVTEAYDDVEVVARRQVRRDEGRSDRLVDVWSNELTDRQRTVVETAYFAGFFEWPRATSGEEVADRLDIAGPTFSQHLRAAQQKLFARLVGADPDAVDFTE